MVSRGVLFASVSILVGLSVAFFNMFWWGAVQYVVATQVAQPAQLVVDFYFGQALATALVIFGLYLLYKVIVTTRSGEVPSVLSVMKEAFASMKAVRVGVVVGAVYAVLYAFFSSLIVYQPSVDFAKAYGITQPGWVFSTEGSTGAVPKIVIYVAPSFHIGMQLLPLTLLFFFLVPLLVGFNTMLSFYALRLSSFPQSGRWLATSGAVFGLFTACPTCAGLFLASSVGGIGTTLAAALAPYQLLFVAVALPVLLIGPVFTALSVKRSYEASCAVPSVSAGAMTPG